jgi:hypothetical protein
MAYAQSSQSQSGNTWPWLLGFGIFGYLWYEGYLAEWLGASTATPTTSATAGSTTPTVTEVSNGAAIQSRPVQRMRPNTGSTPYTSTGQNSLLADGLDQSTLDLANESYYTWKASGQPLSVLEAINAAAAKVGNAFTGGSSSSPSTPSTSVTSGSTTPTVNQVATPSRSISMPARVVETTASVGLTPSSISTILNTPSVLPSNILALLATSPGAQPGFGVSTSVHSGATTPSVAQISTPVAQAPMVSTVPSHTVSRGH